METTAKRPVHVGHNIQKFRLIRGHSQGALADLLEQKRNKPVSQQFISDLEERELITDEELLKQIADILETTPEVLKTLDIEYAINVIGNTFNYHENDYAQIVSQPYNSPVNQTTNNPLERILEFFEKKEAEYKNEIQELKKELERLKGK